MLKKSGVTRRTSNRISSRYLLGIAACSVFACASIQPSHGNMTDVVSQLASADRAIVQRAVEETFDMGAVALPALMKLRGNRSPFRGDVLGHPRSAQLTFQPDSQSEPDRIVTVEVAALYLIEAIYRGNLHFAQSAYLTDVTVPEEERTTANTRERVDRAWQAAAIWISRHDRLQVEPARQQDDGPLSESGVRFW